MRGMHAALRWRVGALLALAAIVAFAFMSPVARAEGTDDAGPTAEITELDGLSGKVVGAPLGTALDLIVQEHVPGIKRFEYFSNYTDMIAALTSNKIDAFIADEPAALLMVQRNTGIAILPESVEDDDYGFCFPKGSHLTKEFDSILERYRADGTLDALKEKWCGPNEEAKVLPDVDWDTPNGRLVGAVDSTNEPIVYIKDGASTGYAYELVLLCCKELGYEFVPKETGFDAMLASVQSGKADIGVAPISITEERRSSMDLSVPMYNGAITLVVRGTSDAADEGGFFAGIAASFTRTFLVEARWKQIVSGLGITLLISVSAALAGTLLGYLAMRWRYKGRKILTKVVNVCEILLGRLPIVVVLMVFYYVVFGATKIPGVVVAIIVFTLSFAAGAEAVMWNAVSAIDGGQREASLALGFTEDETFGGVVLPQAARRFLPLLKGNFVSLIKDTSVVGFIAVTDLTRAGDLIRARTMEAFFPLLAVAVIYFVACTALAALVQLVINKTDRTIRPRAIEGVEL